MKIVKQTTAVRLSIALLVVMMMVSLTACGGSEGPGPSEPDAAVESAAPVISEEVVTEEAVEETAAIAEDVATGEAITATAITATTDIHAFDVEEGLALLVDSGQTEIVIDGGYKQFGEPFAEYIEPYVDGDIELVIATHSHADHVGGLTAIYDAYQVDKTIYGDEGESKQFAAFWEAANGEPDSSVINDEDMTLDFDGGLSLTIIEAFDEDSNTNNNSVISLFDIDGVKVLVTGDAEDKVEQSLSGKIGDVDVYYVGHHGSETSSTQSFLDEINPDVGIISSIGPSGQYENPNWGVMERLLGFTPDIFATYLSGNIVVTVKDGDISVSAGEGDRLTLDNYGGTKKAESEEEDIAAEAAPEETPKEETAKEETAKEDTDSDVTVYITDSGKKYHVDGCRYLKKSKHGIALSNAKNQGYEPCSVCDPPE